MLKIDRNPNDNLNDTNRERESKDQSVIRPCPVCHQDRSTFLMAPSTSPGPVVRCWNCQMIYISPVLNKQSIIQHGPVLYDRDPNLLVSNNLDDMEGSWELTQLHSGLEGYKAKERNHTDALNVIGEYFRPEGKLLDFGCGWGLFLNSARKRGWKTFGLEPLPIHAIYSRVKSESLVVCDTLHPNTFPPNFFDFITTFQVFEHLPHPELDLSILYKMIRPGGGIMIEVPNIDTLSVKILGKHHRHFVMDHLNFFSRQTLERILTNTGFEVLKTYYTTRYMTLRHFLIDWIGKYLNLHGNNFTDVNWNFLDYVIGMNLRDIITIIAKKPV